MALSLARLALVTLLAAGLAPGVARAQDAPDFSELSLALTNDAAGTRVVIRVKADSTIRIERTGEWNAAKAVEGKLTPEELAKLCAAFRGADVTTLPREIRAAVPADVKTTTVELESLVGFERRPLVAKLNWFEDAASGVDYGERLRPLLGALSVLDVRLSKGQTREVVGSVGVTSECLLFFCNTKVDVSESSHPQTYSEVVISNDPWKKLLKGESLTRVHLFGKVTSVKNNAGMWLSKIDVQWIKASAREEMSVRASDGSWTTIAKGSLFKVTKVQDDGRTFEVRFADGRTARVDAAKVSLGRRLIEEVTASAAPTTTPGLTGTLTGTVR